MKTDWSEEEIKQIEDAKLDYKKTKDFFHCKHCIEQFLGSQLHDVMTPRDYGMYEVGKINFTYPDGRNEEIAVVWCKRCGRIVWDSRRYQKMY